MQRTELKSQAKKTLFSNYVLMSVYFLPSVIAGLWTMNSMMSIIRARSFLINVGFFTPIILILLLMGTDYICRKSIVAADKNDLSFRGVLSRMSVENFLVFILVKILIFAKTFLWSLLFIIPGIYKGYEYMMVEWIIVSDDKISVEAAFQLSRRLMHNYRFNYFVLEISFILWNIASSLTAGLVGIFLNPYRDLTFYEYFKSRLMQEGVELNA